MMTPAPSHSELRIHAIVLTCDRPETLRRCLSTALRPLSAGDELTVLDDSCDKFQGANRAALREVKQTSQARVRHVQTAGLAAFIQCQRPDVAVWLERTAPRDIADAVREASVGVSKAMLKDRGGSGDHIEVMTTLGIGVCEYAITELRRAFKERRAMWARGDLKEFKKQ